MMIIAKNVFSVILFLPTPFHLFFSPVHNGVEDDIDQLGISTNFGLLVQQNHGRPAEHGRLICRLQPVVDELSQRTALFFDESLQECFLNRLFWPNPLAQDML
jgi:hypothetical protein